MTFLEAVNRIFRENGVIRGDTDAITSFAQTQHNASVQLAQIAVQNELIDLTARKMLGYERTSGNIALVTSTRVYSLPSDFRSFAGTPHFTDANEQTISEYPGGLANLELHDQFWDTTTGQPLYWYWDSDTAKKVGFWQVPGADQTITFRYEKTILISSAGETVPLHNDEENFTFVQMCSRRFKFMYGTPEKAADIQQILENDRSYINSRTTLYRLLKGQEQYEQWGHRYE